jgi:hypothetical protein
MIQKLINYRTSKRTGPRPTPLDDGLGFTIRFAYPDDELPLHQLAALDSQPLPTGPLLVAEVAGELWAAVSVTTPRQAIADPFRHTVALVALLRERAERLAQTSPRQAAVTASQRIVWS